METLSYMFQEQQKSHKFFNIFLSIKDEGKKPLYIKLNRVNGYPVLAWLSHKFTQSSHIIFKFEWDPGAVITFCRAFSITKLWLNTLKQCLHVSSKISTSACQSPSQMPASTCSSLSCSLSVQQTPEEMGKGHSSATSQQLSPHKGPPSLQVIPSPGAKNATARLTWEMNVFCSA